MKDNYLFTVTNINLIDKLKDNGIKNFVYPLSFFCVGIPKTFDVSDMKEENSYIYVNRVLDTKSIDELDIILHKLPSNIKGIIFDDIGLIEVLKDVNIQKILYLTHFNTNYESINIWFDYVDDIIVSTDITESEIDEIISKSKKKISLFTFGLVPGMYSRRYLNTAYDKHYGLKEEKEKDLYIENEKFISIENDYGTVIYHYPYYNALRLLKKDVHYHFFFPILLNDNEILELSNNNVSNIKFDEGFLDKKTIYKIKK